VLISGQDCREGERKGEEEEGENIKREGEVEKESCLAIWRMRSLANRGE